jgi:hypothetical protein
MASAMTELKLLPYQEKELKVIKNYLKAGENLHIYGAEGTGKSFLLDWIYDNFNEIDNSRIPIYCRSSRTLKQILLYISGFLLNHFKHLESIDKFKRIKEIRYPSDIKKLNIRTLRNLVFSYILQDDFCVILDHLEYVTTKINSFLTVLYERVPVISASRQSWELTDYAFRGKLDYCLYLTPKLKLENLKKKDAFVLMAILCRNLKIDCTARQKMFDSVFRISKGNPGVISTIFEKAQRPKYHKDKGLNLKLIMIDSRIEDIA